MNVEILYFDGCPHFERTLLLVRSVASELGLDADVGVVQVEDGEHAQRLRFFGSPTVQVNGVDVDPAVSGRTDYALGCRLYGRSGTPPRELIEEAMREGRAA